LIPQKASAGRNLITVFESVNNLADFFSRRDKRTRCIAPPTARVAVPRQQAAAHRRARIETLKTSNGAACINATRKQCAPIRWVIASLARHDADQERGDRTIARVGSVGE